MSLSHFRDSITNKLQERVDAAAARAINVRVNVETTSDGYALVQADTLSEARAYAEAAKIVLQEYKRMTEAPETEPAPETEMQTQAKQKDIY